jgi:hypothetical protein
VHLLYTKVALYVRILRHACGGCLHAANLAVCTCVWHSSPHKASQLTSAVTLSKHAKFIERTLARLGAVADHVTRVHGVAGKGGVPARVSRPIECHACSMHDMFLEFMPLELTPSVPATTFSVIFPIG